MLPTAEPVFFADAFGAERATSFGIRVVPTMQMASIAIIGQDPSTVSTLREANPGLFIICLVRDARGAERAAAAVVELVQVGADRCLVQPTFDEIAAQIVAAARRLGPASPLT